MAHNEEPLHYIFYKEGENLVILFSQKIKIPFSQILKVVSLRDFVPTSNGTHRWGERECTPHSYSPRLTDFIENKRKGDLY